MAIRVIFPIDGLDIGNNSRNLTYLYGLSDFWASMFADSEKIELLLEANSQKLSDVYSRFLQLTTTISIADIEVTTAQQIKLVLIKDTDIVQGKVNTYKLSETITQSRFIANRMLLPTAYLENDIHYRLSEDGTEIQFFEPLAAVGFANRRFSDESTEYSLWFVDTLVDEQYIYQYYGKLIGVDPQTSTDSYKNFIYGLYYLFTNGPNLSLMKKGLNLALGIPLARETETVIEIRKYLDTDQWVVVTDLNSYVIPFGLEPTVAVDDVLEATQELAEWVEVKDWINDGDWWINLAIPEFIMPYIPAGETDRFAKAGSYADYIMRNFLKTHVFLVNIKTLDFKNIQKFEQLFELIQQVKPAYTTPIYIWSVPKEELINFVEDLQLFGNQHKCENLSLPIDKLRRDAVNPMLRDCPVFTRYNVPYTEATQLGGVDQINLDPRTYQGESTPGIVNGYVNVNHQFRANTDNENGWFRTFMDRGQESFRLPRSYMIFDRAKTYGDNSGVTVKQWIQPNVTQRVIFLYATIQADLVSKFATVGSIVPGLDTWSFTLFQPAVADAGINTQGINEGRTVDNFLALYNTYSTFFTRGAWVSYLGNFMPTEGYKTWSPLQSDIQSLDYLLFIRVFDNTVGVYWVTSNQSVISPNFWTAKGTDPLSMSSSNTPISHGLGYWSGVNFLRGCATITAGPTITNTYSDTAQTTPIALDRSGVIVKIKRDWY